MPAADQPNDAPSEPGPSDPPSAKAPSPVRVRSLVGLALWALVVFLAFRFFSAVVFVVLCGLGAAALAAALRPLANLLPGPKALRAVGAVLIAILAAGVFLGGLGVALYGPITESLESLPAIRERVNEGLDDLTDAIPAAEDLGIRGAFTAGELGRIVSQIFTGGSVSEMIPNIAGAVLTTLLAMVVIVIGAAYLLGQRSGDLSATAVKLLPPPRQAPTRRALEHLEPELRWWLIGTLISMTVIGVVFGLGYWLIGLEFAVPLALGAALAQAVPTFGPMITLLLSVLIALTQGVTQIVGVFVIYLVVQGLESYLLTPMVMRRAVKIPPIITLFTIILWGNIFGVAGLIFAIPIDLTIWSFVKQHLVVAHNADAEPGDADLAPG